MLTRHAQRRRQQRAISVGLAEFVLDYGRMTWSHGDRVFMVRDRDVRGLEAAAERVRGCCVVVCPDGTFRTLKWSQRIRGRPGILRRRRLLGAAKVQRDES